MVSKNVLIPVPTYGFDPSEAAIPWKLLTEKGINVVFATPNGNKSEADRIMVTGKRLGIWKSILQARKDAISAYSAMEESAAFSSPIKYEDVQEKEYDAILLPGGHDKGAREYLESEILQHLIVNFFNSNKPVAAICHGVILVARSIDPATGQSVIYNYKTTALLKSQELLAYRLTQLWLKDYYLTYPGTTTKEEVKLALSDSQSFVSGPLPIGKDSLHNLKNGFFVRDRNFVSARWPGDVYSFSLEFLKMVENA